MGDIGREREEIVVEPLREAPPPAHEEEPQNPEREPIRKAPEREKEREEVGV